MSITLYSHPKKKILKKSPNTQLIIVSQSGWDKFFLGEILFKIFISMWQFLKFRRLCSNNGKKLERCVSLAYLR